MTGLMQSLLAEGLEIEREEHDAEREGKAPNPYFSDIGRCPRAIFFRLIDAPVTNPFNVHTLMHFKAGIAYQESIARTLLKAAQGRGEDARKLDTLSEEEPVEVEVNGHRISGRGDFYLTFVEIADVISEIKATNSWSIKKMPAYGYPEHRKQLNLYGHVFGVDALILYYCERDRTMGRDFGVEKEVTVDHDVAEGDLFWLAQQAQNAADNLDPGIPAGFKKTTYPCKSCKYRDGCWEAA